MLTHRIGASTTRLASTHKWCVFISIVLLAQGCNSSSSLTNNATSAVANRVSPITTQSTAESDKSKILEQFHKWISDTQDENSDLSKYYADELIFYKLPNCTRAQVLAEKQRMYKKYYDLKLIVDNQEISKSDDNKYLIAYDKTFSCINRKNSKPYTGKVRSIAGFSKINGEWLITAEYDDHALPTNDVPGLNASTEGNANTNTNEDVQYFPLIEGARYEYVGESGSFSLNILASDNIKSSFETIFRSNYNTIVHSAGIFTVSSSGILKESTNVPSNGKVMKSVQISFPVKVGTSWSQPYDGGIAVHRIVSINETIVVPAGEFRNCVKVVTVGLPGGEWYAPGIGIVKSSFIGELVRVSGLSKN